MIIAKFPEDTDKIMVEGLTQWDKGRKLRIELSSIPESFEVHFANRNSKTAIVEKSTAVDGVCVVNIPDEVLTQSVDAIAWVYATPGEGVGKTIARIDMPIEERPKPEN